VFVWTEMIFYWFTLLPPLTFEFLSDGCSIMLFMLLDFCGPKAWKVTRLEYVDLVF